MKSWTCSVAPIVDGDYMGSNNSRGHPRSCWTGRLAVWSGVMVMILIMMIASYTDDDEYDDQVAVGRMIRCDNDEWDDNDDENGIIFLAVDLGDRLCDDDEVMIIYTYNDDEVDNYDDLVEVELDGWPGFLSSNALKALFNHYNIFRVSSWRTPILFWAQLLLSSPSTL